MSYGLLNKRQYLAYNMRVPNYNQQRYSTGYSHIKPSMIAQKAKTVDSVKLIMFDG